MPTFQAAPNVTALNAVTALSNPNGLLIHSQWDLTACNTCVSCFCTGERPSHYLQCPVVHNLQPSTQYSFVEAACTTAGCQTGGVANVTTLDSAPVGQAPPPHPQYQFLFHVPPMECSPPTRLFRDVGPLFRRPQSSSIPTTPAAFSSTNSVMTDFLGVKLHVTEPSTMASNTFYVTVDTVHAAAITAMIVPLLTMKHVSYPLLNAPDGFDAVSVQNVGSTYIIVSWDLPTDSNGILINFSLYCNGALAGVLPLTVISYNTTGLLPFTLYMYMSSSHARRHCTPVEMWCWASSVLQPACPVMYMYTSRDISGKITHTIYPPCTDLPYGGAYSQSPIPQLEQDVGSAEQEAVTMKESPLKNLILFFLRLHPSLG
ncbi:hypothetical protein EMCRGX_G024843 [Ephydatia muelleri]